MEFVCDTNVWYDIGAGTVDPSSVGGCDANLLATPMSLYEIASHLNDKSFPLRKKAARAVVDYSASVLPDPESILAQIWQPETDPLEASWLDGFKALAEARSLGQLQSGVRDFRENVIRRLNGTEAARWKRFHYDDFEQKVCAALEPDIPGYTAARKNGKVRHLKKESLAKFSARMRSLEFQFKVVMATWDRVLLSRNSGNRTVEEKALHNAIRRLAPYAAVVGEYYIECAGRSAPQPNDWGDLECFIYIRPDLKLLTSDKKWIKLAAQAHVSEWVVDARNP